MKYLALTVFAMVAGAALAHGDGCCDGGMCSHCAEVKINSSNPDVREQAFWAMATEMKAKAPVSQEHEAIKCAECHDGDAVKAEHTKAHSKRGVKVTTKASKKHGKMVKVVEAHAPAKPSIASEICAAPCCAPGAMAHYKVFAGGTYHFFGCEDAAEMGRKALTARGYVAGEVQAVVGKHAL